MIVFQYDKTFEGLLTALFHAYNRRVFPDRLLQEAEPLPLFCEEVFQVVTESSLADRVWRGAGRLLPVHFLSGITACWLSEQPAVDELLFRYLRKAFDSKGKSVFNLTDANVAEVSRLWKKVNNEATRVIQFVRFQKTADDIYFAATAPIYNVLPLTMGYFTDRFADQHWMVYDVKRQYGYYYDGQKAEEVRFEQDSEFLTSGILPDELLALDCYQGKTQSAASPAGAACPLLALSYREAKTLNETCPDNLPETTEKVCPRCPPTSAADQVRHLPQMSIGVCRRP